MYVMILPGLVGVALAGFLLKKSYGDSGEKNQAMFLISVIVNVIAQIYLGYQYIVLRGGFKVHNCIYGVAGALLLGAAVLWASRMLFAFAHEGFRVLLGVSAITAGWLGGNGIDIIVSFNADMALISSAVSAYAFCLGALAMTVSDLAIVYKNFSMKDVQAADTVIKISGLLAMILMAIGAVIC